MINTGSSPERLPPAPTFGIDRASDFAPQTEQQEWLTIGVGAWMYDSPMWDPRRIRLGRIDKSTRAVVRQRLERPNDPKKRVALEVVHPYTGKDGRPHESIFWVYPKKGGFYGMPKPPVVHRPKLKL